MNSIKQLENIMLDYGLIIRAIAKEKVYIVETRHKDRHPNGVEYYDEVRKRNMLKVVEKNNKGGKFIITQNYGQGTIINNWGKPVVFYDTIEEAINSIIDK